MGVIEVEIQGEPVPPSFSVQEYIDTTVARGYTNDYYYFNFDRLVEEMPKAMKSFSNDCIAKAILSHCYGELLAKDFRDWVRTQYDESKELPCGGATCGDDEEGLREEYI